VSSQRLTKVGELAQTPERRLALVNGDGTAYAVQDSVARVWDEFEGNTPEEVAEKLAKAGGLDPDELQESVNVIATKLEDVGLLVPVDDR
jgi:Coenzyme PQQ synthesis protein D (PqqD)